MSSSNLAVRMDDTATDLLFNPPRSSQSAVSNSDLPVRKAGPRISLTNRKFMTRRDQGLKYFRVR